MRRFCPDFLYLETRLLALSLPMNDPIDAQRKKIEKSRESHTLQLCHISLKGTHFCSHKIESACFFGLLRMMFGRHLVVCEETRLECDVA